MKRSEINQYLQQAYDFCGQQNFHLPEWATWSPQEWEQVGEEADEIRECGLGWDVTDFCTDRFSECGLTAFTIRNGVLSDSPDAMLKDYCEKVMIVRESQLTPTHFHWSKMEDIINRGGGNLVIELWNADPDTEQLDEVNEVNVSVDGVRKDIPAGGKLILAPGQSVTLPPYMYHNFYGEQGKGTVLVGEVSRVNDDENDNRFLEPLGRFPGIEEDEEPKWLLCTEYPAAE
ncbi:MAG: D-lyxose/D-mannose family sugar isomerase [Phycisphaerae bacterium]